MVSAVRVSRSTFEFYRDGDPNGYTVPEITGVTLKMAQTLLDIAVKVEENETLEFGDTSEVEVTENDWTKDAMGLRVGNAPAPILPSHYLTIDVDDKIDLVSMRW